MRNVAPPVHFIAVAFQLFNNTDTHTQTLSYNKLCLHHLPKLTDPLLEPLAELKIQLLITLEIKNFGH